MADIKKNQYASKEDVKNPSELAMESEVFDGDIVETEKPQEVSDTLKEAVKKEIQDTMESIVLNDDAKAQALDDAGNLQQIEDDKKVEELLKLAKTKGRGVVYAITVAEKMGNSYVIDKLHDKMSADWQDYKQYLK